MQINSHSKNIEKLTSRGCFHHLNLFLGLILLQTWKLIQRDGEWDKKLKCYDAIQQGIDIYMFFDSHKNKRYLKWVGSTWNFIQFPTGGLNLCFLTLRIHFWIDFEVKAKKNFCHFCWYAFKIVIKSAKPVKIIWKWYLNRYKNTSLKSHYVITKLLFFKYKIEVKN